MKNYTSFSELVVSLCLDTIKNQGEEFHLNNDTDSRGFSDIADTSADLLSFECKINHEKALGLITPNAEQIKVDHRNGVRPIVLRVYRLADIERVKGVLDNEGFFTRIPSNSEIVPTYEMDDSGFVLFCGKELESENYGAFERALCFNTAFDLLYKEE